MGLSATGRANGTSRFPGRLSGFYWVGLALAGLSRTARVVIIHQPALTDRKGTRTPEDRRFLVSILLQPSLESVILNCVNC